MNHCPYCRGESIAARVTAREMVQATREAFPYVVCADCGSVRIEHDPKDIAPYYVGYYTLAQDDPPSSPTVRLQRLLAWGLRPLLHCPVLRLLRPFTRRPPRWSWSFLSPNLQAFLHACPSWANRILDVGCGNGAFAADLRRLGFTGVQGIDPFIDDALLGPNRAFVRRGDIGEVTGQWDLVMFHHSLEHSPDPVPALTAARRLLAPEGRILVHLPNAGSPEFRRFGGDWWGLHAPRHYHLPTRSGMRQLCARLDLAIVDEVYTSRLENYLYSSEYAEDLADHDPGTWRRDGADCRWSGAEIEAAARTALRLNAYGEADWICYTLAPAAPIPLTRQAAWASVGGAGDREDGNE